MNQQSPLLRTCLRDPIPEIFEAAQYLADAVMAHLEGNPAHADTLIRKADLPAIFDWTESLWGVAAHLAGRYRSMLRQLSRRTTWSLRASLRRRSASSWLGTASIADSVAFP
jgi:hypothetical protein